MSTIRFEGHTPGPWHLHEKDKYGGPEIHAEPAGTQQHYVVAVCRLHEAISDPIGNANGHLIAAAPELLRQRDMLLSCLKGLVKNQRLLREELTRYREPDDNLMLAAVDNADWAESAITECEKDNA